jgi:hypothetical protein
MYTSKMPRIVKSFHEQDIQLNNINNVISDRKQSIQLFIE